MEYKCSNVSLFLSLFLTITQLFWTKSFVPTDLLSPATSVSGNNAHSTLHLDLHPSKMIALSHSHYHQPLVLSIKDGTHSHTTFKLYRVAHHMQMWVLPNIIRLNYSYCTSPRLWLLYNPPSYPSDSIITPTTLNSVQTRILIRPNTLLCPIIRTSGQRMALDLRLGLFF